MGNREMHDTSQADTDIAIAEVRGKASRTDARVALKNCIEWLKSKPSYFNWIPVDVEGEATRWLIRVPRHDGEYSGREIEIVHLCHPIDLWEHIQNPAADKELTVPLSSYAKELETCLRCEVTVPKKAVTIYTNMNKLAGLEIE